MLNILNNCCINISNNSYRNRNFVFCLKQLNKCRLQFSPTDNYYVWTLSVINQYNYFWYFNNVEKNHIKERCLTFIFPKSTWNLGKRFCSDKHIPPPTRNSYSVYLSIFLKTFRNISVSLLILLSVCNIPRFWEWV